LITVPELAAKALGSFLAKEMSGRFGSTHAAHMGWADMATVVPIAEHAARAAILADSEDPWAHYALASVYLFTRRFDDSLAEFEVALQLNPNFSLAQGYYGLALSYCGRWEEGDLAAGRALRLSPRDPFSAIYSGIAAYAQFVGCNYDAAMHLSREGIRERGDFVGAHRVLRSASKRHRVLKLQWGTCVSPVASTVGPLLFA
jgi:tetratricopeptide (TPR) repeat protein